MNLMDVSMGTLGILESLFEPLLSVVKDLSHRIVLEYRL